MRLTPRQAVVDMALWAGLTGFWLSALISCVVFGPAFLHDMTVALLPACMAIASAWRARDVWRRIDP